VSLSHTRDHAAAQAILTASGMGLKETCNE